MIPVPRPSDPRKAPTMRRRPLSTPLLALLLAVTACSGDEPAEGPRDGDGQNETAADGEAEAAALRAAEGFVASVRSADGEAGCALMDEAARTVVADTHEADDCVAAFPLYAESLEGAEEIEVGEVTLGSDLDGETPIATVPLVHPSQDHGSLELRQDSDDQWVATRVPGVPLGGAS